MQVGGALSAVDLPVVVQELKIVSVFADRFRCTKKEDGVGAHRVVQHGDQAALEIGAEVDQHVAHGDEVHAGKRGIGRDVLDREHHLLPHFLSDLELAVRMNKEAAYALRTDVLRNRSRINPGPGGCDGFLVDVRAEDLDFQVPAELIRAFLQQYGQGIRFLPGGASGSPDTDRVSVLLSRQPIHEEAPHDGKGGLIPEELRHVDQQVLEQRFRLRGVAAQKPGVLAQCLDVVDAHPPLDAPLERGKLVAGEVALGPKPDGGKNLLHVAGLLLEGFPALLCGDPVGLADVFYQGGRHLGRREDEVRDSGGYGGPRHPVVASALGVLDHDHAELRLDFLGAERTVPSGSGQDDPQRTLLEL